MSPLSTNTPTVTLDDPRIADIVDATDMSPQEVLNQAAAFAAEDGVTVSEELDEAEAEIDLEEAIEDEDAEDDEDEDEDEDDEAGDDLTGWSESDPC